MTSWHRLEKTLDAAARRGEAIRFWWRDDDAGRISPSLTRLLEMAERFDLPLALAVVPDWLQPDVQGQIAASPRTVVLQHGFAHADHAGRGEKAIELGGRAPDRIMNELGQGFSILKDAFGAAFLPVLVPPWNRIDEALLPRLREGGYAGLSVFGERADREIVPGVSLVNTHVDPVDWRGTRGYRGDEAMLALIAELLELDEPIGVLSHHLAMDEACWAFLERLFATLMRHPAARPGSASALFASPEPASGHAA